jgi:hypothetical protein
MSEAFPFEYLPQVLAVQHRQPGSKTILAWQKVLEEREKIFSPFYGLVDCGSRRELMKQKRVALSKIFLDQAYAVAGARPSQGLQLMLRSLAVRPMGFFGFQWAGVLKRAMF